VALAHLAQASGRRERGVSLSTCTFRLPCSTNPARVSMSAALAPLVIIMRRCWEKVRKGHRLARATAGEGDRFSHLPGGTPQERREAGRQAGSV